MRLVRLMTVVPLIGLFVTPSWGQTVPYEAAVALPEVPVRSGPSSKFYVTSKLRQGDRVRVVGEKDEWLAIVPPAGSFSWINGRLLNRTGQTAVILAPEAPTRIGSSLNDQLPDVEGTKLQRGAQVIILGKPQMDERTGTWWPIQPPPQDRRYIPRNAVRNTPAVERVSSGYNGDQNALWQQANDEERRGNSREAQRLFAKLAAETKDHDLQMRCYNRIEFLRRGNRGSVPQGYQPGRPQQMQSGTQSFRPIPQQNRPVTRAYPTGQTQAPGHGARSNYNQSSPGRLRRAGFFVDGKQAYVLEDSRGRTLMYVTAGAGLNLAPYVNRTVTLSGPIVYRGELRTNYIQAYQVRLLQ